MNFMHLGRAFCLALCLGGCSHAGESGQLPQKIAPPSRIPHEEPVVVQPPGTPVTVASVPRTVRRAVVADAARRFEVPESDVVLSNAEQVTWADGSLGCPQPGMSYTQALVPGYRLLATTPAGRFLYHTDTRGQAVTCAQPMPGKSPVNEAVRPGTEPRAGARPDR
jgi:hypothetical protein